MSDFEKTLVAQIAETSRQLKVALEAGEIGLVSWQIAVAELEEKLADLCARFSSRMAKR